MGNLAKFALMIGVLMWLMTALAGGAALLMLVFRFPV